MNRKGFTLIEVLAVIIILGITLVFVVPGIMDIYKNSKLKSEQIFIKRLSGSIDSHVKLNSDELIFSKVTGTFEKKYISSNGEEQIDYIEVYEGKIKKSEQNPRRVVIDDIISEKLISEENYINAGNKEKSCNKNAEIEVYKDSDYVYCYKVQASELNCLTDDYIKSICPNENQTCYVIDTCMWSK